jgi:hypothetical protein
MPSSVIRRFHYDAPAQRLDVLFVSGEAYSYFDVPAEIVTGLQQAQSKGRYFQLHIRDRFHYLRDRSGRVKRAQAQS